MDRQRQNPKVEAESPGLRSSVSGLQSSLIVLGSSVGGLSALEELLAALPDGFGLPLVAVQHRQAAGNGDLVALLQRHSALPVSEPGDKEPILPGRVYVAPADYHLLVGRATTGTGDCGIGGVLDRQQACPNSPIPQSPDSSMPQSSHFCLSTDAPVNHARPSVDVLFESAADSYGERAVGVILTGNGHDGASGLARIKACGGTAIVQDPDEAEAPGMPEAAIAATEVDQMLSLDGIAEFLVEIVRPNT